MCYPSLNINSADWALWLNEIATKPKDHSFLCEKDKKICFLRAGDIAQWRNVGTAVTLLTAEKIMEISKKFSEQNIADSEKDKIFAGLEHISGERKNRLNQLPIWRWVIAFFSGRVWQIKNENEIVNQLQLGLIQETLKCELHQAKKYVKLWQDSAKLLNCSYTVIREIEKRLTGMNIQQIVSPVSQVQEVKAKEETIDGKRVIFDECMHTAYIKGDLAGEGSNKKVYYASEYTAYMASDVNKYVIIQPIVSSADKKNQKTALTMKHKPSIIKKAQKTYVFEESIAGTKKFSEEENEKSVEVSPIPRLQKNNTLDEISKRLKHKGSPSSKPKSLDLKKGKSSTPQQPKNNRSDLWRKFDFNLRPVADDPNKEFLEEVKKYVAYSKYPEVWPTLRVLKLENSVALLQYAAGYNLTKKNGQQVTAISLYQMQELCFAKELTVKDQCVFLSMTEKFLISVNSLHSNGIIHRDIKPANILCSRIGTAGISDFGCACSSEDKKEKQQIVGTLLYMSPEVAKYGESNNLDQITVASDIWSIGIVLWHCYSGKVAEDHPAYDFLNQISGKAVLNIALAQTKFLLDEQTDVAINYQANYSEPKPNTLSHLVWQCTRPDFKARPAIAEVIQKYKLWAEFAEKQLESGQVQNIQDCFDTEITAN